MPSVWDSEAETIQRSSDKEIGCSDEEAILHGPSNWMKWEHFMMVKLMEAGLWETVSMPVAERTNAENAASMTSKARTLILDHVDEACRTILSGYRDKDPHETWKELKKIATPMPPSAIHNAVRRLCRFPAKGRAMGFGDSAMLRLWKLQEIREDLMQIPGGKEDVIDQILRYSFLESLPDPLEALQATMLSYSPKLGLDKLVEELQLVEELLCLKGVAPGSSEPMASSKSRTNQASTLEKRQCFVCEQNGYVHILNPEPGKASTFRSSTKRRRI